MTTFGREVVNGAEREVGVENFEDIQDSAQSRKCAVPVILGLDFITKIKLFTLNKRLLEDCLFSFGDMATFKWIGSPQQRINFVADGKSLTAGADTGSDRFHVFAVC